jgi:hypothetical protein
MKSSARLSTGWRADIGAFGVVPYNVHTGRRGVGPWPRFLAQNVGPIAGSRV